MSRLLILSAVCVAMVSAQDEAAYIAWMKGTPPQVAAINAAILAKDNVKVAAEANQLAVTYQQIADFWAKRQNDDAVKLAEATRDAAKEVAVATDTDGQTAAFAKVQASCGDCHKVYREGTPGNYKIKS
jgi:hypothetical protein